MNYIIFIVVILLFVVTYVRNKYISTAVPISQTPTEVEPRTDFHIFGSESEKIPNSVEVKQEIKIQNTKNPNEAIHVYLTDDFRILADHQNGDSSFQWTISNTYHRSLSDIDFDIGAWAAVQPTMKDPFDLGIRISPGRFLYEWVSPDLLLGAETCGLGVSLYIPRVYVSYKWSKFGVGVGYFISYDALKDWQEQAHGLGFYISLSTYF